MNREEFLSQLKQINKDLELVMEDSDENIFVTHPSTKMEYGFVVTESSFEQVLKEIRSFFSIIFVPNQALYYEDYFEVLVGVSHHYWVDTLGGHYNFEIPKTPNPEKIYFELTSSSAIMDNFLEHHVTDFEAMQLTSLKIYNLNKHLSIPFSDKTFLENAFRIGKSVIFDVFQKSSLPLKFVNIEDFDEDDYYLYDELEEAKAINKTIVEDRYDKDLVAYFYRAMQMEDSEFKYLAYYQVIECIFDEVYLHETVQDVIRIVESNSFTTTNEDEVTGIIDVVTRYNKEQNDKSKTRLVLEKYFKGEVHSHAFLMANKGVISILKDDLKKIKEEKDLEDIQKLSNIIYDFRCECTHSNRAYPIKRDFDKSKEELMSYLHLIRLISQSIIRNYKR